MLVVIVLIHASGEIYMNVFVIEIMKKLTEDSSKAFHFTLAYDSMKIFAGLLSSVLVRLLNRRAMVIFSAASLIFFMGMISLCSYLVSKSVISAAWLVPSLLIAFNVMCHIGLLPFSAVIVSEVIPLQFRGLGVSVSGIVLCLLSFVVTKMTSIMLDGLDLHGTFVIYLIIATCAFVCLIFILPETKDKTLQHIEMDIMDVKINFDKEDLVGMPLNSPVNENK